MSQDGPPGDGTSKGRGTEDMKELLGTYARYAALVRFQEAALDEDDLDRFEDLAKAREQIQAEVGAEPPAMPAVDYLDPDDQEYLEKIHEEIREALLVDMRIRARLQKMRKNASHDIKTAGDRSGQAKEYLTGEEAKSSGRLHRLNVRL